MAMFCEQKLPALLSLLLLWCVIGFAPGSTGSRVLDESQPKTLALSRFRSLLAPQNSQDSRAPSSDDNPEATASNGLNTGVPPTTDPVPKAGSATILILGVACMTIAVFMLVLSVFYCVRHRNKLRKSSSFDDSSFRDLGGKKRSSVSKLEKGPRAYTLQELSTATKGFSSAELLGSGSSGIVYRGILPSSGTIVAVKRVTRVSERSRREFMAEIGIISKLQHRNLVSLYGWCQEAEELLIVYEFMVNGSLDKLLFNTKQNLLTWEQRFKIIFDVATALAYLHGANEQPVIHRDVKASNVLLNSTFNAQLGDYGIARSRGQNRVGDSTSLVGTLGYLAPECVHGGKVTEKVDIYNFGIMVLEMTTGRKALETSTCKGTVTTFVLNNWVGQMDDQGRLLEVVDPRLENSYDVDEMRLLLHMGVVCSRNKVSSRPSMEAVVRSLQAVQDNTIPCRASIGRRSPFRKSSARYSPNDNRQVSRTSTGSPTQALGPPANVAKYNTPSFTNTSRSTTKSASTEDSKCTISIPVLNVAFLRNSVHPTSNLEVSSSSSLPPRPRGGPRPDEDSGYATPDSEDGSEEPSTVLAKSAYYSHSVAH